MQYFLDTFNILIRLFTPFAHVFMNLFEREDDDYLTTGYILVGIVEFVVAFLYIGIALRTIRYTIEVITSNPRAVYQDESPDYDNATITPEWLFNIVGPINPYLLPLFLIYDCCLRLIYLDTTNVPITFGIIACCLLSFPIIHHRYKTMVEDELDRNSDIEESIQSMIRKDIKV